MGHSRPVTGLIYLYLLLYQIQACFKVYAQILLKEWWRVHVNHAGRQSKVGAKAPLPISATKFEYITDRLHLTSLIFPPIKSPTELIWYVITLSHLYHLGIFPVILFAVSIYLVLNKQGNYLEIKCQLDKTDDIYCRFYCTEHAIKSAINIICCI